MSMREWLIVAGVVILVGVIADLIRRYLQRGKLKLKLDKQFQDLPEVDLSAELPNGGARVVNGEPEPQAPTSLKVSSNLQTDSVGLESRSEPRFSEAGFSSESGFTEAESSTEPQRPEAAFSPEDELLSAARVVETDQASDGGWKIDPLLSAKRDAPEAEVDLLMEKEFKGVGQGADHWLKPDADLAKAEPHSEVDVLEPSENFDTEAEAVPQSALDTTLASDSAAQAEADDADCETATEDTAIDATSSVNLEREDDSTLPVDSIEEPLVAQAQQSNDEIQACEAPAETADVQLESQGASVVPSPANVSEPSVEVESDPIVSATVSEAVVEAGSVAVAEAAEPLVALAEAKPKLDLDRPVHELLQEQQARGKQEPEIGDLDALEELAVEPEPMVVEEPVRKPAATRTGKRKSKRKARAEEQTSFFDLLPDLAPEPEEKPKPKARSRRRVKKAAAAEAQAANVKASEQPPVENEVLVINVHSRQAPFPGAILFKLLAACGMEHGAMQIFHRHEDAAGQGAVQFSMANAVAPGTFEPQAGEDFSTPAVTFFMSLAEPTDRMTAFECMLATAQCVADNLDGELKDENRSSLRSQTIEHYRQKVREFERKQLTRRV